MKKILYLSFYFEPDVTAGSFRNTSLVKELAKQAEGKAEVFLLTTKPNRYSTFKTNIFPNIFNVNDYFFKRYNDEH